MRIIHGELLHLAAAAFDGDPYLYSNLAHLRWMMDDRLGFPRTPFVLERRPSLRTAEGRNGLAPRTMVVSRMTAMKSRPGVKTGSVARQTARGGGGAWSFDFQDVWARRGTGVCWVELRFRKGRPPRDLQVTAVRNDRGQEVKVDAFEARGSRAVRVQLSGSQIDRIDIEAASPPTLISVLTLAQLDAAPWQNAASIPIATTEHTAQLGRDVAWAMSQRIAGYHGPRQQHPLDAAPGLDPLALPMTTPAEIQARYLDPWVNYYEPIVARVLNESSQRAPSGGTRLHQSEVVQTAPIASFTTPGGGLPDAASQAQDPVTVGVYAGLMAAAVSDFHFAKLLGLAYVAEEPVVAPPGVWDYRLTGVWEVLDLAAIVGAIERRAQRLLDLLNAGKLPAEEANRAQLTIGRASADLRQADDLVKRWTLNRSEPLTVCAFAIGVSAKREKLPAAPAGLAARSLPPRVPGRRTGEARLTWAARPRARASDGAGGDYAAIAWRDVSGSFAWLNPPPADPMLMGGLQPLLTNDGAATIIDRNLPVNAEVSYCAFVCDAWNRWSERGDAATRVDHRVPPPAIPCEASLLASQINPGQMRLRLRFRWDVNASWDGGSVNGAPSSMTFTAHLHPTLPTTEPEMPTQWGGFPARPGSAAGPLVLPGATGAATLIHDGAQVQIAAPVDVVDSGRTYRLYDLSIDPVQLAPGPGGLQEAFVSLRTRHATEGECPTMGQAARVAYMPSIPPSEAVFAPDPLLATWADADGRSTAILSWTQSAQPAPPDWAQVLWAGEAELIAACDPTALTLGDATQSATRTAALATLANSTATLGQRAQALKDLAMLCPNVFSIDQERVPLVAGPVRLVVALPGALTTLRVYVVRPYSASGVTPSWPTDRNSFVVVRVPQAGFPVRPVVVQSERVSGTVRLRVSKPPLRTAKVGRYELYRTQDVAAAASGDFRRMRLVASRPVVDADWQAGNWAWFDDDFEWGTGPGGVRTKQLRTRETVELIDPNPLGAPASYCVVARADGPAGDQGRSPPSVAIRVA
jgi:hypothetical protein